MFPHGHSNCYHPCYVELGEQPEEWLNDSKHRRYSAGFIIRQVQFGFWQLINKNNEYVIKYYDINSDSVLRINVIQEKPCHVLAKHTHIWSPKRK